MAAGDHAGVAPHGLPVALQATAAFRFSRRGASAEAEAAAAEVAEVAVVVAARPRW